MQSAVITKHIEPSPYCHHHYHRDLKSDNSYYNLVKTDYAVVGDVWLQFPVAGCDMLYVEYMYVCCGDSIPFSTYTKFAGSFPLPNTAIGLKVAFWDILPIKRQYLASRSYGRGFLC